MSSPESARPEGEKKEKEKSSTKPETPSSFYLQRDETDCKSTRFRPAFQAFRTLWKDFLKNILTFLPVKRK